MKKLYPIILLSKTRQHGWIMLEVVLCLALFSVILHLASSTASERSSLAFHSAVGRTTEKP